MAYTLSNLLLEVLTDLGQTMTFKATGGSTTTAVNGNVSIQEEPPEDDYILEGTLFVVRDAGGANAAPEGEYGRISDYVASTWTYTVDTALTTAIASGDIIAIANANFPFRELERLANICVRDEIGLIPLVDVSLTTLADTTEYAVPVALKNTRPRKIQVAQDTTSGDYMWRDVTNFDFVPAAAGSTGLLVIPEQDEGYTIKIWYDGVHPELTAYSSVISETIPRPLIKAMMAEKTLRWWNNKTGGSSDYWRQMHNDAKVELDRARTLFRMWKPKKLNRALEWTRNDDRRVSRFSGEELE